jgi:hypothetical protein
MSAVSLWAQGTSQIQGIVKDATGAVIGGVEVKATQTETGVSRTVISSEDGVYFLPNLAVGPYRLEASKPGFSIQRIGHRSAGSHKPNSRHRDESR